MLPFPQDRCLDFIDGDNSNSMYFIPVPGQPISANHYYIVRANGQYYKGLVETCSKEEDVGTSCFCRHDYIEDLTPQPLDTNNPYQQIHIIPEGHRFTAKCIASDGLLPAFLRSDNWGVVANNLRGGHAGRLAVAHVRGENTSLRAQSPPFHFSLSETTSPIVTVGEWYCPFIFVKEQGNRFQDPKVQLKETPFYKMDLQKFWEQIYSTEVSTGGEEMFVHRTIRVEEPLLLGSESVQESIDKDGSVWFKGLLQEKGKLNGVRLSWPIIAKMRADQGREESDAIGRDVRVEKLFNNNRIGRKFVCYVVVERYVLKRMDGSIVLTYSFRKWNQIQGRWS